MSVFDKYPFLLDPEYVTSYEFAGCMTSDVNGPYHDLDVAAALLCFSGNMTRSAAALGRSRRSLVNYVARSAELSELLEDIREELLDLVDEKLRLAVEKGDISVCKFLASTMGKERGYTTRDELTGANGGPIMSSTQLDLSKMTDDELAAYQLLSSAAERNRDGD